MKITIRSLFMCVCAVMVLCCTFMVGNGLVTTTATPADALDVALSGFESSRQNYEIRLSRFSEGFLKLLDDLDKPVVVLHTAHSDAMEYRRQLSKQVRYERKFKDFIKYYVDEPIYLRPVVVSCTPADGFRHLTSPLVLTIERNSRPVLFLEVIVVIFWSFIAYRLHVSIAAGILLQVFGLMVYAGTEYLLGDTFQVLVSSSNTYYTILAMHFVYSLGIFVYSTVKVVRLMILGLPSVLCWIIKRSIVCIIFSYFSVMYTLLEAIGVLGFGLCFLVHLVEMCISCSFFLLWLCVYCFENIQLVILMLLSYGCWFGRRIGVVVLYLYSAVLAFMWILLLLVSCLLRALDLLIDSTPRDEFRCSGTFGYSRTLSPSYRSRNEFLKTSSPLSYSRIVSRSRTPETPFSRSTDTGTIIKVHRDVWSDFLEESSTIVLGWRCPVEKRSFTQLTWYDRTSIPSQAHPSRGRKIESSDVSYTCGHRVEHRIPMGINDAIPPFTGDFRLYSIACMPLAIRELGREFNRMSIMDHTELVEELSSLFSRLHL